MRTLRSFLGRQQKTPAFTLSDPETRGLYDRAYSGTTGLYYKKRPSLEQILVEIARWAERL
jgi:hypothetical protein